MLQIILIVVLVLLLLGSFPTNGYGLGRVYAGGSLGTVLLILVILKIGRAHV